MKVPSPLPEAVAAGIFGIEYHLRRGGHPPRPTRSQVADMQSEHFAELRYVLADLQHVEKCLRLRIHPQTLKPVKPDRQPWLLNTLEREQRQLAAHYQMQLAVWEQAFGPIAAHDLDHFVRNAVAADLAPRQQFLFNTETCHASQPVPRH
jgi:hypothetical protein